MTVGAPPSLLPTQSPLAKVIPHPLRATLTCHSATPSRAVRGIELDISRAGDSGVALRYALAGEVSRLLVPTRKAPSRADRLSQHTCFELFCAAATGAAYYELNFSPSTDWAICRFTGYREGMANVEVQRAPQIVVDQHATGLELQVIIDLAALPELRGASAIHAAASAVIEDVDGSLSYWALTHPSRRPDFHHPDAFALALDRSDA